MVFRASSFFLFLFLSFYEPSPFPLHLTASESRYRAAAVLYEKTREGARFGRGGERGG